MSDAAKSPKRAAKRTHPLRTFYIYTAENIVTVEANSLPRAIALSGIDEKATPIVAALDSVCVPQYRSPESVVVAVVLRNSMKAHG